MHKHVYALGIIMIGVAIYHLMGMFFASTVVAGSSLLFSPYSQSILTSLVGSILAGIVLVLIIPMFIAGFGLARRRRWARALGMVVCCIYMLHIPLGTIIGIYGLWVLMNNQTIEMFEGRSQAVPPSTATE